MRHAQDGVKALLQVFDHPARFLQALIERGRAFALMLAQSRCVQGVHAHFGQYRRVDFHMPGGLIFFGRLCHSYQHIGHDDVALGLRKTPARLGLQRADELHARLDLRGRKRGELLQLAHVAACQILQRLLTQFQRHFARQQLLDGVIGNGQGLQLQAQAFAQIARAQARRIQSAQQAQRHGQVVQGFRKKFFRFFWRGRGLLCQQRLRHFGQRVFEVAVFVERFDQAI